jgi:hypothetical protein
MQTRMYRRGGPVRVAAVLAAVLTAVLTVAGCSGSDGSKTAGASATSTAAAPSSASATDGPVAGTSTPKPSGKPGVPALGATGAPRVAISRAPVVKVGKVAKLSADVEVYVGKVRELKVKAEHPGEIAGPAAAVQISVTNKASTPFSLTGLAVTASYGKNLPGDETSSGPSKPLTGSLAAGKSARGVYVFMVPTKDASSLHLEVSSDESPTIVQFAR